MKDENPKEANSYVQDTSIPPKSFSRPVDEDVDEDEDFFWFVAFYFIYILFILNFMRRDQNHFNEECERNQPIFWHYRAIP